MMPEDRVALTIARRTKKNLHYIYERKNDPSVEEFTQLINSMLGIVISLREEYFYGQDPVTWNDIELLVV